MASYQDFIQQAEDRDGIRMTWNVLPASKTEGSKLVVPLSVLFTPLKDRPGIPFIYAAADFFPPQDYRTPLLRSSAHFVRARCL